MQLIVAAAIYFTILGASAEAYIGPGLGAGTIGVVLGVIASVFLALFAILWYPLKRLLKKRKTPPSTVSQTDKPEKAQ